VVLPDVGFSFGDVTMGGAAWYQGSMSDVEHGEGEGLAT